MRSAFFRPITLGIALGASAWFAGCAKNEPPLELVKPVMANVYAINAQTLSCKTAFFALPTTGTPAYDVQSWFAILTLGGLNWTDKTTDLAVISIQFKITSSNCVAPFTYTMADDEMACLTVVTSSVTSPGPSNGLASVWKTNGSRPIVAGGTVVFPQKFYLGGLKPLQQNRNCTANGNMRVLGVSYDTGTQLDNARNVQKDFPFSTVIQF